MTDQKIRVAMAGNRKLFREFFCIALRDEKQIDIVADVENLHLAIDAARKHKPEVFLLDIACPESNVVEILADIRKTYPDTRVLVLAPEFKEEDLQSMIKAGAHGYISTTHSSKADLINAVKAVHAGEFWVERKITAKLLAGQYQNNFKTDGRTQHPKEILTAREMEVLGCLSKGYSNQEIASVLFISIQTVKSHINSIFKKLNITSRLEALLFAINHGLLQEKESGK